MQGKMHPSKNFKDVQKPVNIDLVIVDNLQVQEIWEHLHLMMCKKHATIFVDLEGSGVNGCNDEKDDESNGGCN